MLADRYVKNIIESAAGSWPSYHAGLADRAVQVNIDARHWQRIIFYSASFAKH